MSIDRKHRRMHGRRDDLIREFERGPFPTEPVTAWPPALVEIVEQASGRPFDPRLLTAYERVRAFMAYEGVVVTDALRVHQSIADPHHARRDLPPVPPHEPDRRQRAARAQARPPGAPAPVLGAFDPEDLGD